MKVDDWGNRLWLLLSVIELIARCLGEILCACCWYHSLRERDTLRQERRNRHTATRKLYIFYTLKYLWGNQTPFRNWSHSSHNISIVATLTLKVFLRTLMLTATQFWWTCSSPELYPRTPAHSSMNLQCKSFDFHFQIEILNELHYKSHTENVEWDEMSPLATDFVEDQWRTPPFHLQDEKLSPRVFIAHVEIQEYPWEPE